MLTVKESLQLKALKEVRVVAGGSGLDREVRWCHIIDNPEIVRWIRGGELLLTTGYGWPATDDESRRTVRALNGKRLAAMLFEPSQSFGQIPGNVLDEANRLHLPILKAPRKLPFVDVTEAIGRELDRRHYEMIARADRYHRLITVAAVEARDLNDLARTLRSVLRRPVTIVDPEFRPLGHADADDPPGAIRPAPLRHHGPPPELRRFLQEHDTSERLRHADGAIRLPASPGIGTEARVVCAIRAGADLLGYLCVPECGMRLNDLDCRVAEHGATVVALHILRQRAQAAVEARIGHTVVDALIRGDVPEEDLLERARLLGFDVDRQYAVMIATLRDAAKVGRRWALTDRHEYHRRERTGQTLWQLLEQMGVPALCTYTLNQIVYVLPMASALMDREGLRRFVGTLYQGLTAAEAVPPVILTVGTAHAGLKGVSRSYWESDRALALAKGDEGVLFFEDCTFAHLLAQIPDSRSLEAMYVRTLGRVLTQPKSRTLRETLWAFVDSGFKNEAAAVALGVHRNTLRGRLQRVQTLLGRSLADPALRRDLGVAREIAYLVDAERTDR